MGLPEQGYKSPVYSLFLAIHLQTALIGARIADSLSRRDSGSDQG